MVILATLVGTALFETQSLAAWMSAGICVGLLLGKLRPVTKLNPKNRITYGATILSAGGFFLLPIGLQSISHFFPETPSIQRRVWLNQAALQLFRSSPFTGVGLNQFTVQLENVTQGTLLSSEVVRFVQPAHHVGVLFLAETGVLGVVLTVVTVLLFLRWVSFSCQERTKMNLELCEQSWQHFWKRATIVLAVLVPLASLDHYLYTQQTGALLLVVFLQFV